MVQRVNFGIQTNLGNVAEPQQPQDCATRNYVDQNSGSGLTLDTPGSYSNASVASGNIVLTTQIGGQSVSTAFIQSSGAAGTETQIIAFINGRGANQVWAFASAPFSTFTITASSGVVGQVSISFAPTAFPVAIPAGTILTFQTTPNVSTQFRDLILGTGLTGSIANTVGTNRPTLTLNSTGGAALRSAISVAQSFVGDNIGILVHPITTAATQTGVSGVLTSVNDAGLITITSANFPPTIPGANTSFLIIESSDFSWSGTGLIQRAPNNAIIQVAWIRPPAANLTGTSFTNANIWVGVTPIASTFVGTSLQDADNRPAATTLVYPDIALNSISNGDDNYGGTATSVLLNPSIDGRIASKIGSTGTITQWPSTVSPAIASVTATTIVLDDEVLAPQLIGQYLWVNSSATQPNTVFVSSGTQTGVQYTLTVVGNPISAGFSISTQNIWYSSSSTPNSFVFQPPPRNSIIALAQANCLPSLNGIQGVPATLTAGSGISISTTSPTIQISSTSSGVVSGNSTTFEVGQRDPASVNLRGFANTASGFGYIAMPLNLPQNFTVTTTGGQIGSIRYLNSNQDDGPQGNGIVFPTSVGNVANMRVTVKFPAFTCQATVTGSSPSSATFAVDEAWFALRTLSTSTDDPTAPANQAPGFAASAGNPNEAQPLGPAIRPIITATFAGGTTWNLSFTASEFSASINNFALTGNATTGYQAYLEIEENTITQNITGISNIVSQGTGSMEIYFEIPGSGTLQNLQQTLSVGNSTGPGTAIAFQDTTTPTPRSIALQAPTALNSSFTLRLPSTLPASNNLALVSDTSGSLSFGSPNLQQVLASGNSASASNILLQGGRFISNSGFQLNGGTAGSLLLQAPPTVTSYSLVMPPAQGLSNTTLVNDGAGSLSWGSAGSTQQIAAISTVNVPFLSGTSAVDGYTPVNNDQVLLTAQTTASQNGLYLVSTSGAWARQTTFALQSFFALNGTTNNGSTWSRTNASGNETYVRTAVSTGSVPGGTNLSYQFNNGGVFSGDLALTRDVTNGRVNVASPIGPNNPVRLIDLQSSSAGVVPVDPANIPVHVSELNLVGTYVNNSGLGSATLSGTGVLNIAGRTPNQNDIVLLVAQSSQIQNGPYTVLTANYSMTIVFGAPNCFPTTSTSVDFAFSNVVGGSAGFSMLFAANQTLMSAAATRPANLDASWNYSFTNGNTITLSSTQTAARWTNAPAITITLAGGITFQGGVPNTQTFTPMAPFTLRRTSLAINYGQLWVANAPLASNFGVQFFNTTPAPVTVGTTAITYVLFGVSNPINTLQVVTSAGNTTNQGIAFQPSSGSTNAITLTGSPSLTASRTYQLNMSSYPLISGTPLTCDINGNLGFQPTLSVGNTVSDNLTITRGSLVRSGQGDLQISAGPLISNAILLGNSAPTSMNSVRVVSNVSGAGPLITTQGETTVALNITSASSTVNIATGMANFLTVRGAASGAGVMVQPGGTDTSAELSVASKGLSGLNLGNSQANYIRILSEPSGIGPAIVVGSTTDTNVPLQLRGLGTQGVIAGTNGQFFSLGPVATATWNVPLLAANAINPTGNNVAGQVGQFLGSRGSGLTPAWLTPPGASLAIQVYALNGDQNLPATPFQFNTTATYTNGTAFGSFVSATQFAFSVTGYYFVSFSYNVLSGVPDISIVINGVRVAGSTIAGKVTMTGGSAVTAGSQVLSIQNYVSANFSAGQSNLQIVKLA